MKKYCPELKNVPAKYIYEPWKASVEDQLKFGCMVGSGDDCKYPSPIVDHEEAYTANVVKMKVNYKNQENIIKKLWKEEEATLFLKHIKLKKGRKAKYSSIDQTSNDLMSKKLRAQLQKEQKSSHIKTLSMKTIDNPTGYKSKLGSEMKLKAALNRVKKL